MLLKSPAPTRLLSGGRGAARAGRRHGQSRVKAPLFPGLVGVWERSHPLCQLLLGS